MAQINHATRQLADPSLFAAIATLCLLLCMIVMLVGIKLWWFKHRLNFDHSSTRNGAAGGSQPNVVPRQRSAKDKRLSQQFHDSVEVHGVFRKRGEDEWDITPAAQLPPVRLRKLSQSTPALFLPPTAPRRQRSQQDETAKINTLPPPSRLPPRPPPAEFAMPSTPIYEIKPSYEEYDAQSEYAESANELEPKPITTTLPPQAPKRALRSNSNEPQPATTHKFLKAKSSSDAEEHKKVAERRATGYLKPSAEELREIQSANSTEEFGERRPTGYIKYEEIDDADLEDFRDKWHNVQKGMKEHYFEDANENGRMHYETVYKQNEYLSTKERRPTSYVKDSEKMWQDVELEMEKEKERQKQKSKLEEPAGNVPEICVTSEHEEAELAGASNDFNFDESPPHIVTFAETKHDRNKMSVEKKLNLKKRRPTGFVTRDSQYWQDLEHEEDDSFESDENLWTEMQKDLDTDFTFNVEEEFNKIRHSYEANEGDFLEIKEELGKSNTSEPKGFGKSIDEDWDSFENLQNAKEKAMRKPEEPTEARVITFNLSELEDADEKESTLRKERRPTGYVHNRDDLFKDAEWQEEDQESDNELAPTPKTRITFELQDENEDEDSEKRSENSILKERRPTAFVKRDLNLEHEIAAEHEFDAYFPEPERKPKPRQKVTFDFNTEEHYLPAVPTDSEAEDDAYTANATREAPQPRQRITKTRFEEEEESVITTPPPMLFSSQISHDDNEGENVNDSWTAIRQHRYMTEEFQQISLKTERVPAPRQGQAQQPVPAYRNPLAQVAVSTTTIEVESESSFAKVTRKQQQTRQYFEHTGTSITEA